MSTSLAASIVTPGSTPPDASLTVPEIDAWANAEAGRKSRARTTTPLVRTRMLGLRDVGAIPKLQQPDNVLRIIGSCHITVNRMIEVHTRMTGGHTVGTTAFWSSSLTRACGCGLKSVAGRFVAGGKHVACGAQELAHDR